MYFNDIKQLEVFNIIILENKVPALSSVFHIAEEAYKGLMSEFSYMQDSLFNRSNTAIKSALVNYQAFWDFKEENNSSGGLVSRIDKRQGGHILTTLENDALTLDFAKVASRDSLPSSKYRQTRAALADNRTLQLSLFSNPDSLDSPLSYGIVTFIWTDDSIEGANIVFPDRYLQNIASITPIPLLVTSEIPSAARQEYKRKSTSLKHEIKESLIEEA